jgi:hypothetical protein
MSRRFISEIKFVYMRALLFVFLFCVAFADDDLSVAALREKMMQELAALARAERNELLLQADLKDLQEMFQSELAQLKARNPRETGIEALLEAPDVVDRLCDPHAAAEVEAARQRKESKAVQSIMEIERKRKALEFAIKRFSYAINVETNLINDVRAKVEEATVSLRDNENRSAMATARRKRLVEHNVLLVTPAAAGPGLEAEQRLAAWAAHVDTAALQWVLHVAVGPAAGPPVPDAVVAGGFSVVYTLGGMLVACRPTAAPVAGLADFSGVLVDRPQDLTPVARALVASALKLPLPLPLILAGVTNAAAAQADMQIFIQPAKLIGVTEPVAPALPSMAVACDALLAAPQRLFGALPRSSSAPRLETVCVVVTEGRAPSAVAGDASSTLLLLLDAASLRAKDKLMRQLRVPVDRVFAYRGGHFAAVSRFVERRCGAVAATSPIGVTLGMRLGVPVLVAAGDVEAVATLRMAAGSSVATACSGDVLATQDWKRCTSAADDRTLFLELQRASDNFVAFLNQANDVLQRARLT